MGILVVEFHGAALVDRVLLEAFFFLQHGEEAALCVYFNFVVNAFWDWQIRENIEKRACKV
jgi:hypothetical protein